MKAVNVVADIMLGFLLFFMWACESTDPTQAGTNGAATKWKTVTQVDFEGGKFLAQGGKIPNYVGYIATGTSVWRFNLDVSSEIKSVNPVKVFDHRVINPVGIDCFSDTLAVYNGSVANFYGITGVQLPFLTQVEFTSLVVTERGVFTSGQPSLSQWTSLAFRRDIPVRGKPRTILFSIFRQQETQFGTSVVASQDSVYILGEDFKIRKAVYVPGTIYKCFITRRLEVVVFTGTGVYKIDTSEQKGTPVKFSDKSPRIIAPEINGRGFIYPESRKLYRQSLDGGAPIEVKSLDRDVVALLWTRSGEYLLVLTSKEVLILWEPSNLPKI